MLSVSEDVSSLSGCPKIERISSSGSSPPLEDVSGGSSDAVPQGGTTPSPIITGSSLTVDYKKLGYSFIAYVGIFLNKTSQTQFVLERLKEIPHVTVAHVTTGKFNIFCKIRARKTSHAKEIIFQIDDIEGVTRTETMISLEESINDKKRLMHSIFNAI